MAAEPVPLTPPAVGTASLRQRLLRLALLPLAVVLPVLLLVLVHWGVGHVDRLLVTKVQSDLAIAHGYFERVTEGVGHSLTGLADSHRLFLALPDRQGRLLAMLDEARRAEQLDFLRFHPAGQAIPPAAGSILRSAWAGRAATGLDVFSPEALAGLSLSLSVQAETPLIPTRNARPDERLEEKRGLMIHAAAPVRDATGRLLGVLEGGLLLNKNLAFIDRINELVYPPDALPLGSHGTATLFLDDVRVATNVRLFEGERAIGTRVSAAVRDKVLGEGELWLDRAFVVSDWYVSGYRPLTDNEGRRIGMLYVGFLEGPFAAAQRNGLIAVIALFALAMSAAAVFAVGRVRQIFRPIARMHATMTAIEGGTATARVGPVEEIDELGQLAAHLDRLLDRLAEQAESLQRWGESLDSEVAARTADLEAALHELQHAQSRLLMQEKLAAIGQLTAGLAHEINNPVAVIQGNVEVLREVLGPAARPVDPEIRLILEQVQRVRLIVAKLLQFARPHDFAGELAPVAAHTLFQDCLLLVNHLLKRGNVKVELETASARQVQCNPNEIQQVLINLMVNAIEAMPDGGRLTLQAEDWDEAEMPVGVRLIVRDTGRGIPPEVQARLFQPFFTASKPGGNGLGLWVSQALVERYGGRITLASEAGQGSCFTVWLRSEPLLAERA